MMPLLTFQSAQGLSYPAVEDYTKSACQTLGFSRRTCGYIGHGFQLWLFASLFNNPKENSVLLSSMEREGKKTYKKALLMKQKED